MESFALPTLKKLILKFYPETDTEIIAELPHTYYSFEYRRIYAKLRGAGYFVNHSETLFNSLIYDIL